MARVAVVTDSTAWLPLAVREAVRVVPLRVTLGDRTGVDGVDVTAADVAAALRAGVTVSTSRPAPEEFAAAFRSLLDSGATHVVAVHLSAALSGTQEAAVLAAAEFEPAVVRVVDSRSTAMGLGVAVQAACECAAAGGDAGEVERAATSGAERTRTFFVVDSLEHLRRGGRIGAAAALVGTTLAVKPLLQLADGQIVPLEKVRTTSRATARLVTLTATAAAGSDARIGVHHLGTPERAEDLAELLRSGAPSASVEVAELGPVIGAHLGPGVLGTVVAR